MKPVQRRMIGVSVFVLSFFLCLSSAHAREKPEIVRLDAHFTANVVKMSVHWQSANPVTVVQAIVGGKAHELRVDPYDNRRNPDGFSGAAEILVNVSPSAGAAGIPYVVEIEDDLRQKSEQVTGMVRTSAAGAAGMSGSDFQTDAGTQRALLTIQDLWAGPGRSPPSDPFDPDADSDYGGNELGGGDQYNDITAGGDPGGQWQDGDDQYGPTGSNILQNDSGSIAYFLPLSPGDEAAVYLDNQSQPFTIEKVHFAFGGTPDTGFVSLGIYEESETSDNLQELYTGRFEIPPSGTYFRTLDLSTDGDAVPVWTGSVLVSFQMEHDGLPGIGFDDSKSVQPGVNWIRWQGSWYEVDEQTDLEGNAIIRVEISDYKETSQEKSPDAAQTRLPDLKSPVERSPADPSEGTTVESGRDRSTGDAGSSVSGSSSPETSSGRTPLSPSERTVEWSATKGQTLRDLTTSGSRDAAVSAGLLSGKDPITRVSPKVTSSITVSTKGEKGSADVTGFSPTTVTLTRGGVAQTVNVQGRGLQNAMVHVVKDSTVVRDVTAGIRNTSATGCQVVLEAPSSGTGTGRDYVLRIVAGGEVLGKMSFAVEASTNPVSVKPDAPIKTIPDGFLRK